MMESFAIEKSIEIQKYRIVVVGFGSSGSCIIEAMNSKENNDIEFIKGDEDTDHIKNRLLGADMVFITGGLGGRTGQIVAPDIAKIAKEANALTIGIVTQPFHFEGKQRLKFAEETFQELKKVSNSVVIIRNDELLSIIDPKMGIAESFKIVDNFLARIINGITGVILPSGDNDINLDFVDLKSIMSHRGTAFVGMGESQGNKAAYEAINNAIEFLNTGENSIKDASGVLIHFTTHPMFPFIEIASSMDVVHRNFGYDADIIFGTTTDDKLLLDHVCVIIVATWFDKSSLIAVNNTI